MKLKKPRKNEVHLWKANLDQPSARVDNLLRILSREERERADRFHLERDRNRFVVGRGLLRKILGRYLVIDAAAVRFEYNATEKPFLASGSSDLRFNLSHSQGLVVYALALGRDVGVDVERVRSDIDWEGISGRYFSASENKALRSFPEKSRPEAFFEGWTRKEAFMKAKGKGFSIPLHRFDVSFGEPARILKVRWSPKEASRWSLHSFRPAPGYVAALAVEGHDEVRLTIKKPSLRSWNNNNLGP